LVTTIADAGGHFVSDNVEGALQEVGIDLANPGTLSALQALDTASYSNGDVIYLRGRTSVGDGGEGHFRWDSSDLSAEVAADEVTASEGNGGIYIAPASDKTGASGAWVRQHAAGMVNVRWYGAMGDGSNDDTVPIQRAIDTEIYIGPHGSVYMPAGLYRITNTIHLGYGDTFHTIKLVGDGYAYRAASGPGQNFQSTTGIDATAFSDRPAIAVQGARGTSMEGIGIVGANATHILDNKLGNGQEVPLLDDVDPANWVDPLLAGSADSRYAPYAGIAVDPYSGPAPATAYPDVDYPSFTGISSQYNKANSSDVSFNSVYVSGFVVGYVNKPSNDSGNADFTNFRNCSVGRCKYGFSVGNSQSRNVLVSGGAGSSVYTMFTSATHGTQQGQFGSGIYSFSTGNTIQIFDMVTAYTNNMVVHSIYAESTYRMGNLNGAANASNEISWTFVGCNLTFALQKKNGRGKPLTDMQVGSWQPVEFIGGSITGFDTVFVVGGPGPGSSVTGLKFDGTQIVNSESYSPSDTYLQLAQNALCGGVVMSLHGSPGSNAPNLISARDWRISFNRFDIDTGVASSQVLGPVAWSNRAYTMSPYMPWAIPAQSTKAQQCPFVVGFKSKSAFAGHSITGTTLTLTGDPRTDTEVDNYGGWPGDVIYDSDSGNVYFIRARTGSDITAELQNNLKDDGAGGFEQDIPASNTSGVLYFLMSRMFTPYYPLRGDITSGNPTMANVGDARGVFPSGEVSVGDWLFVNVIEDRPISATDGLVTGVDEVAKTITLEGNFAKTRTYSLFPFWIRKPPANV